MISLEKLLLRHLDLNPQPSDQHFLTNLSYRDVQPFASQRSGNQAEVSQATGQIIQSLYIQKSRSAAASLTALSNKNHPSCCILSAKK